MKKVSERQLERYPVYLRYLLSLRDSGVSYISSPTLAKGLGFSEEQVRKDLQVVSKEGKPKTGRDINELIEDIKSFLNYDKLSKAAVIGVGHLGQALMNYRGFNDFGLEIVCGFDSSSEVVGKKINDKDVYSIYQLANKVEELGIKIAILATPSNVAQEVCSRLSNAGIKAIWNFVPIHLVVSDDIVVENINMASSFAILQHKLISKGE